MNSNHDDSEFDIPPASFQGAMRGRFAHLLGENPEDERRVSDMLREKGFQIEAGTAENAADLSILKAGELLALCEIKTLQPQRWKNTRTGEIKPIESSTDRGAIRHRLRGLILSAERVLQTPAETTSASILIILNHDSSVHFDDLLDVLSMSGSDTPRIDGIDACLWLNLDADGKITSRRSLLIHEQWAEVLEPIFETEYRMTLGIPA